MSRILTFIGLSAGDKRRLITAAVLLLSIRVLLSVRSIKDCQWWARRLAHLAGPAASVPPDRVAWAVRTMSNQLNATCLYEALAVRALLAEGGRESELHIGVVTTDGELEAHAWVTVDNEVVIGELEDLHYYQELSPEEVF